MHKSKELFESTKVSKAVWKLAIPTMMGMLVMIIYNIADTFFIGQTGDVYQVAAVSLTTPLFMLLMGFGNLFGIGASTTISRNLGEGKIDRVKNVSAFAFYGSLIVGILVSAIILPLIPEISMLLGASPETLAFVESYMLYLAIGAPFIIVSNTFGSLMRGEGNAKAAMIGMMIGTIINIVLDPLFILTFDMGVAGAAIATVLGNVCSAIYYIVATLRGIKKSTTNLSVSMKDIRKDGTIVKDVFSIGVPGAIGNILMSISGMFYNFYLVSHGDNAVAAMGIATKGSMILAMLLIGFAMGAQPLLGYAYGARNKTRLNEAIKYTMKTGVLFGVVMMTLMITIAPQFVSSFITDVEVIEIGTKMLRAQMSTGFLMGITFVSMVTIQAMGKAVSALIVSISRQGLVFMPMVMIMNTLFGLEGLIWAQPVADTASCILALTLMRKHTKQMGDLDAVSEVA